MHQPVYNFTTTLNSSMIKALTLKKSELRIRIASQISLLIESGVDICSLVITCQKLDMMKHQQSKYDIDLLQEQVLLFDNDAEIYSFIETQKYLSSSITQFIELPFSLVKLSQRYLKREQSLGSYLKLPDILQQYNSKQKLDELQSKCLQNLSQIKERRKKIDCCVICWQKYACCIIQPCMHLSVCKQCSNIKKCPLCKGFATQITNVFK